MGDSLNLSSMLNAKTFAVFGASSKEEKPGYVIFKNLIEKKKKVFGINIKGGEALGHKLFKELNEVPYEVDCAIIATPAKTIPIILRQLGKRNIKNAVIISAGFAEVGNIEFETHTGLLAKELGITLLGPNSFGFINPHENINTSFYSGEIQAGGIAFISQSGAIGSAIIDKQKSFSGFVSIGNALNISFTEVVDYYANDPNTKVICIYMESLKANEGPAFLKACKSCEKPILVLKAGKTKTGQIAAKSHTGSIATEHKIYSGAFAQCGVVECETIEEMFSSAKAIEKYGKVSGSPLIITNAGGLGVLTSDYLSNNNIHVPKLSAALINHLGKILPENWSHNNPIDIVGDADFQRTFLVFKLLEKGKGDSYYIACLTPQHMTEMEKTAKLLTMLKKPTFVCLMGGDKIKKAKDILSKEEIPVFDDPAKLATVLKNLTNN